MRESFLEKLEKRVIVCDGAMGTVLYSRGIALHRCFDELNLSLPQLVKEVHLGYLKAGADLIETNTFGATRPRLEKFNLGGKVPEINLAGARLAREIAGDGLHVAGSVGPLGLRLEPLGSTSLAEAREYFREQIAALVEGGVDLIIVETMSDLNEARQALLAAREVSKLPLVIQMTIQDDGSTPTGTLPEDFTRQLDAWGADAIGINCSVGPAAVLDALERMAAVTQKKLSAQPNAGLPRTIEGRNIYLSSPEYMASYARRFIDAGARLIGGCCGTTPEHIRAIKVAVRSLGPQQARAAVTVAARPVRAPEPVAVEKRSGLAAKLVRGEFPVLAEIIPPKGADPTKEIEGRAVPARPRNRCRKHSGWHRRHGAHEFAHPRRPPAGARGDRSPAPLQLARPQRSRHAIGFSGRARPGVAQHPGLDARHGAVFDHPRIRHF